MKRLYEKRMEEKKRKIEADELLLGKRKKEIAQLKNIIGGQDEVISLLSAFICEGLYKSGRVEISKEDITKGLKVGYNIKESEDKIILEKKSESEEIEIEL